MGIEGPRGRRLRFDLAMADGESIPGAIARGVADHVLVATRPALVAAGVRLRHAGYAQIASAEQLERLAYTIRCAPGALEVHAGRPVVRVSGMPTLDVRFGPSVIPRAYLELDRRRISPLSLRIADHHRLDWMNLLLPYCPESLERLSGECNGCGAELGWRLAVGIGVCETCGERVGPSAEPALQDGMVEDYRLFARLSSPMADRVRDAVASLPTELRTTPASTLVRLALQLGGLMQVAPVNVRSRRVVLDQPAPVLAAIATEGVALLRSWPEALHRRIVDRVDRMGDDQGSRRRFRSGLLQLTGDGGDPRGPVDLVSAALPGLRHSSMFDFFDSPHYVQAQVRAKLRLTTGESEALRRHEDVFFESWSTPLRERGRFDAGQIDGLVPVFRGSVELSACARRFRLPIYGVAQCCRPGMLTWIDDPVFLAVKSRTAVLEDSADALAANLMAARLTSEKPRSAIPLSKGSRRIGGRLKPWGSILQALIEGRLPFWVVGGLPTALSIHVDPVDLACFDHVVDPGRNGPDAEPLVSQLDAAEILNLAPYRVHELGADLGLTFSKTGQALAVPMESVVEAARRLAWAAEVGYQQGLHHLKAKKLLNACGIAGGKGGWCRRQLVQQGLLPGGPA